MELLVFGHAGARVLAFPTSQGKFYEWEDRGMIWALGEHLEKGWLQLFCVDSVDSESWYCGWAHPSGRAWRHQQYDDYLYHEVLPFMRSKNENPFLITTGASFGGYHAMNFGLKHPDKVDRILAMSGMFDIRTFTGGYTDTNVYHNSPVQYIANEHDLRLAPLHNRCYPRDWPRRSLCSEGATSPLLRSMNRNVRNGTAGRTIGRTGRR
jgi:esterase/lipase superfamily enzyme